MIPVILESPYAASSPDRLAMNIGYARRCMADCLARGEAPFASHLLYTQEGVLDDTIPEERALGIEAGLVWGEFAKKTVVYVDLGVSPGMDHGIRAAQLAGRTVEYRRILTEVAP